MTRSLILVLSIYLLIPSLGTAQSGSSLSVATLSAVAPVYPPIALTANTSGDVRIAVTINKTGSVTNADFITGSPLLHRAAVEAAKRWKFEKLNEGAKVQLTFSFRMVPKDTSAEDMTAVFMPPYHLEIKGKLPEPTVNYDLPAHTTTTH